ncbi:MAG: GNAT family N-acetyltransferase [Oscillospiraceae bacterium]|jgi:RimJ/RimL family protein N-acetyltransferase|nr:GNAT family N-acetyltransferase [Oscillospiraceae bacterium]
MKTADIETSRLIIRSMSLDDAAIAWSFWGNPKVAKYLGDPLYKDVDELREVISDIDDWKDEYPFIAYHKETGEPAATCSVGQEGAPDTWGFGYCVREDLWGKGYATEIVKALIDFAAAHGIRKFQGTVAQENIASVRVMEKVGMTFDHASTFRKKGTDNVYASAIYKMSL